MRSRLASVVLASTGLFAAAAASGAEPAGEAASSSPEPDPVQAEALMEVAARERYQEGANAFAAGRYREAIDLFLAAAELTPNPAFSYNIGLAYEALDDWPNALKWYRDYLRRDPNAEDAREALLKASQAERRLAERGVMQLTVFSHPKGATVAIDGEPVGVTPWTGELPPGPHSVTLSLRGYVDATQKVQLSAEHAIDVTVKFARAAAPEPAPETIRAEDPTFDEAPPEAGVRPLTWTMFGVGAVGLGAALGLELARAGAEDAARSASSQIEGKDELDKAGSLQTGARIALGLGAAATVAGGVLLYLDLSRGGGESAMAGVKMGCRFERCGLSFDGTF